MRWKMMFFFSVIVFVVYNCSPTKEMVADRSRTLRPSQISTFHPAVSISVGWVPYEDHKLVRTGKNEWKIVELEEGEQKGSVPVLFVKNEGYRDTILLDMNIENELLGRLIKHSVMTQQPIQRPFTTFFEYAKCESCHPENIKLPEGVK